MRDGDEAIRARLETIRESFIERSLGQVEALARMADASEVSEAERAEILGTVHRLAGASGTFGFPDISRVAGALEDALRGCTDPRGVPALLALHLGPVRSLLVATSEASRVAASPHVGVPA